MHALIASALAAPLLVHDETTAPEVEGRDVVALHELRVPFPMSLPADAVTPCGLAGADLDQTLATVDGHLAFLELDAARALLDAAERSVACPAAPDTATTRAQLHFLAGVVALESDDEPAALAAFTDALLLEPEMGWDERFDPRGAAVFGRAALELANTPAADVALLTDPPARLRLPLGPHALDSTPGWQLDITSTDPVAVLLPGPVPADVLTWPEADRERVLVAAAGRAVELWDGQLPVAPPPPHTSLGPAVLTGSGAAVAVLGAVLAGVGASAATTAADLAASTADPAVYRASRADWQDGLGTRNLGLVTLSGGLVLTSTGLVWGLGR